MYSPQAALQESESYKPPRTPWLSIARSVPVYCTLLYCTVLYFTVLLYRSVPVWAIAVAHMTENYGNYVLLTELPNYMKNVLNYDLKSKVDSKLK